MNLVTVRIIAEKNTMTSEKVQEPQSLRILTNIPYKFVISSHTSKLNGPDGIFYFEKNLRANKLNSSIALNAIFMVGRMNCEMQFF